MVRRSYYPPRAAIGSLIFKLFNSTSCECKSPSKYFWYQLLTCNSRKIIAINLSKLNSLTIKDDNRKKWKTSRQKLIFERFIRKLSVYKRFQYYIGQMIIVDKNCVEHKLLYHASDFNVYSRYFKLNVNAAHFSSHSLCFLKLRWTPVCFCQMTTSTAFVDEMLGTLAVRNSSCG